MSEWGVGGGGGWWVKVFIHYTFFFKCSWGRAGSENDTLLPMTMTGKNSGALAVKSYHPETLVAEE